MVEVVINQKRIKLNLNEFKQLLFREEKQPIIKTSISDIINNNEYKRKYILIKDHGYPNDEEMIDMADDYRKRKALEELIKDAVIKPAMSKIKKQLN